MGVDLRDLFTGRLTLRRLRTILRQLPQTSATARALHGDAARWQISDHLLAGAIDALNVANWQRAAAGAKTPPRKPKPVPRPGVEQPRTRYGKSKRTPEELARFLARLQPAAIESETTT